MAGDESESFDPETRRPSRSKRAEVVDGVVAMCITGCVMASSREKGANDVHEHVVRSFVVENASSGGAVGLLGSANSCAVTREDSSKWRCGATRWIGAKSGGGVDFVETVESAIGNRTRSSEGAVGEDLSANAHA